MKRLTIRVKDDEASIAAWLKNQTNVSASLRLLIQQAARLDQQDYVMHCASQVGTPIQQQATLNTQSTELPQMRQPIEREVIDAQPFEDSPSEPKITIEETVQELPIESNLEPESNPNLSYEEMPVTQVPAKPQPVSEPEDDDDDDGGALTSRMMADARRKHAPSGGTGSFEDLMVNINNE